MAKVLLNCKYCAKQIQVWPYRLKRKDAKVGYCSSICYHANVVGSKLSPQTKLKMSKSHGKPIWLEGVTVWNKGKVCYQFSKENNPNWRDGRTLCIPCHTKTPTYARNWRYLNV